MYLLTKRRWRNSWTVYTCDKLVGSFFLSETFIFQQCCRKPKCEFRNNCTWGSWFLFQDQVSMKTIKPLHIVKNKQKCMPKTLILARGEESLNYLLLTLFKSPDPDSPLGRQIFIIETFNNRAITSMDRLHPVTKFSDDRMMMRSKNWNTFAAPCSTIINMFKLLPLKFFF